MVELKPCPFCGGKAEVVQVGSARQSTIYGCTDCHCQLETGEVFNIGVQWNTRADSLAIAAAVQAEREAICGIISDHVAEDARGDLLHFIRSRPAPAVDVLGVVREFVAVIRARSDAKFTRDEWNKFDALAALVPGAAAKGEGGE